MKGKVLSVLLIAALCLSVFVSNSQAGLVSYLTQYDYYLRQGTWSPGMIYSNNGASLEWVRAQIEYVLSQLEEMGFDLPSGMEETLDDFFSDVLASLFKGNVLIPYLNSELFGQPPYNISCCFDVMTGVMNFTADNVFSTEDSSSLVEFTGDLFTDGRWNMGFAIEGTAYNSAVNRFRQRFNWGRSSYYQTNSYNSSLAHSSRKFSLQGALCQDGLISIDVNPCQTTTINFNGTTYTLKRGLQILQDMQSQEGVFYFDILQDNGSGNQTQIYSWSTPLW